MGKIEKWNPIDCRHFDGKSIKELQQTLEKAEKFVEDFPQFEYGWHNEYRQELKRRIAEMIGRKVA